MRPHMNTRCMILAACLLLLSLQEMAAAVRDTDYNSDTFGGSSYVQHGAGPAYSGGYSGYGRCATGITGRFSESYDESGAVPGYGRFGSGSSYGTGPLRTAGTGRANQSGSQKSDRRMLQKRHASSATRAREQSSMFPF